MKVNSEIKISVPKLFQVELTSRCNLSCSMCAISNARKRVPGDMDLSLFKLIVDQSKAYEMPIHWFHHFGEPLLYPGLREALHYFKSNGIGPGAISTNALLLDEERIDILLENSNCVLCCLDTMDIDAYRKIRNNANFELVKRNISNLISERNKRGNDCQIIIQLLRTLYNENEKINAMMDYFGYHRNLKFIEKTTIKYPYGANLTLSSDLDEKPLKQICNSIRNQLCILSSGECVPCCLIQKANKSLVNCQINL